MLADTVPETGQARFRAGGRPWRARGKTVIQRFGRLDATPRFTPKIIKTWINTIEYLAHGGEHAHLMVRICGSL